MRAPILTVIFSAILVINTFAQKVELEVYAGLIGSILKGNEEELLSNETRFLRRYAFSVGTFVSIPLSEYVIVKIGLGYSPRGSRAESFSNFYPYGSYSHATAKINYVEIPVLLSLGPENIHVIAGPQFSFLTHSDISGIKSTDAGINYGLDFNISRNFAVRFLAYHGLVNMNDYSDDVKMHQRYVTLTVGYKILKGKPAVSKKKNTDVPHRTLD